MSSRPTHKNLLFASSIFTSAFLLFQVQPLLAKFILPWFGGTPAVWTMCMLVFQLLLFGGYAYAHLLSSIGSLSRQAVVHAALLALACISLPIIPDSGWKPTGNELPTSRIALLLLSTAGIPYFLLSSTGPLLQKWFSYACPGTSPYRLYALSNTGSLLALISYPFVFEPALSSTAQAGLWSALFLVFALSCLLCGWMAAMSGHVAQETSDDRSCESSDHIDRVSRVRWFMLAALPSIMLLATTNEVCMDIAVVPFLWIVPLTLYLLSFILTFESERFCNQKLFAMLTAGSVVLTSVMMSGSVNFGMIMQICVFFTNLFLVCMLCHGELVRLKPSPKHLTTFYLTTSAGGAAGGLFVGLIAPHIFSSYCELPLAIFSALLVCAGTYLRSDVTFRKMVPPSTSLKFGFGLSGLLLLWFTFSTHSGAGVIAFSRNFYGVLRIEDALEDKTGRPCRDMIHGRVVHGRQYLDTSGRFEPSTYYSYSSGVGRILNSASSPRKVGVVGLGAGTLAVYGNAGDQFRFYEINPDVIRLAEEQFTFLQDCRGHVQTIPGDARLVLEREQNQHFDVLVLDAFSGDAIPVHLLTTEAMKIYTRHLRSDGILAVHISNSYFDLEPVVRALGQEFSLITRIKRCESGSDNGVALDSVWMLLSRESDKLTKVLGPDSDEPSTRLVYWTDDRNNLLNVLR
ncbi:MAG: spermidine synthase [Planctomycetota bacterium]